MNAPATPEDFAPVAAVHGSGIPSDPATGPPSSGPRYMALMITRRCNMTCGHCSVASGPGIKNEPEEVEIHERVRMMAGAGLHSLQITGGEPMLRRELVKWILEYCSEKGIACAMASNGYWGQDPTEAMRTVRELKKLGLTLLTISLDRFHASFLEIDAIRHIVAACVGEGMRMNLNITRMKDDEELGGLVAAAGCHPGVRVRFYDVQPVGRARHLPAEDFREGTEGFCNAAGNPVLTDDARLMACNGPSYFTKPGSPLFVGSLKERGVQELLAVHREDVILETIRVFGPSRLRKELELAGAVEGFTPKERYHGLCDLCVHINTVPSAVAILRERLARPQFLAELAAMRKIRDSHLRRVGSVEQVNHRGARKLFFRLACDPGQPPTAEEERLLGRADFDWKGLGDYLSACGMSVPLVPALGHPAIATRAPRFF